MGGNSSMIKCTEEDGRSICGRLIELPRGIVLLSSSQSLLFFIHLALLFSNVSPGGRWDDAGDWSASVDIDKGTGRGKEIKW